MTISDPVGDMFARIRNAQQRNHPHVMVPSSKFKKFVLDAMEREGFIAGYETVKNEDTSYDHLKVNLKYVHGNPVLMKLVESLNLEEEFIQDLIVCLEFKTASVLQLFQHLMEF